MKKGERGYFWNDKIDITEDTPEFAYKTYYGKLNHWVFGTDNYGKKKIVYCADNGWCYEHFKSETKMLNEIIKL